jgi:prepilin-type processing-associated H-X9-DG protein
VAGPGNPSGKHVGWRALSLPYLEQESLRDGYDFDVHWWEGANLTAAGQRLAVSECPSVPQRGVVLSAVAKPPRPAMSFPLPLAATDYEAVMGVQPSVDPVLYASTSANRSVMFRNSRTRLADVLDGSSHTLAIVECAARPLVFRGTTLRADLSNDQGQGWIDSEGAFSLDGANRDGSLQGQGPVLTPVAINATNENEPYAFHPTGANVIFADGSARFVRSTVSLRLFAALCTRSGREVVQAP